MNNRIALLFAIGLIAIMNSANAFPLSGGNGEVNATVIGTYRSSNDLLILDIISDDSRVDVVLVDADDKFYQQEEHRDYAQVSENRDTSIIVDGVVMPIPTKIRMLYGFENVPQDVEIKRVRITPLNEGDPFSIEWTGVPEVEGVPLSLKFYGLSSGEDENGCNDVSRWLQVNCEVRNNYWTADVKLKNSDTVPLDIKYSDFVIIDQFGFSYPAHDTDTLKLMPNESMRTNIIFRSISKLSRPIYLVYEPSNLTMDVSAWS